MITPEELRALLAGEEAPLARPLRERPRPIGSEEKRRLEEQNRALLRDDLRTGRRVWSSLPYYVLLQLSNRCNMSCRMCWGGANPPARRMPRKTADALADRLLPFGSVLIPFMGSEPLLGAAFDKAVALGRRYQTDLEIVTNGALLTEKRYRRFRDLVGQIQVSIDTHVRATYEKIRGGKWYDRVFSNLRRVCELARQDQVDVVANAVFMTLNAPELPDFVREMARLGVDTVSAIRLCVTKPELREIDPFAQMSRPVIERILDETRQAARESAVNLILDVERHEFLQCNPRRFRADRLKGDFAYELADLYPGFCWQAASYFKVVLSGEVFPCCFSEDPSLVMGNVFHQSMRDIWNGENYQNLRREMALAEYRPPCQQCNLIVNRVPAPWPVLPFAEGCFFPVERGEEQKTIQPLAPAHLGRHRRPPVLEWSCPDPTVTRYRVDLSLGGREQWRSSESPPRLEIREPRWTLPADLWATIPRGQAVWWCVWGIKESPPEHPHDLHRSEMLTAFIKS